MTPASSLHPTPHTPHTLSTHLLQLHTLSGLQSPNTNPIAVISALETPELLSMQNALLDMPLS